MVALANTFEAESVDICLLARPGVDDLSYQPSLLWHMPGVVMCVDYVSLFAHAEGLNNTFDPGCAVEVCAGMAASGCGLWKRGWSPCCTDRSRESTVAEP